jgi:RNA polymerase sigma-70 factor (ECF subfamily)
VDIPQEIEVPLEEIEWVNAVQNGDDTAFTHLIEKYQNAVYNLCYRMLGNPGDAEDAAQEAFFRAYRALHRYDQTRKFSTWILSIASNYCIDQLRKRRLFTLSLDGIPYLDVADPGLGPEKALLQDEYQDQVRALLKVLNEQDRAAVVLRYWYDYSYDEIAETLALTNSAVKSRLHRARRTLAEAWSAHYGTPAPFAAHPFAYETHVV